MSRMPRVISATPRLQARALAERHTRRRRLLRRTAWALGGLVPLVVAAWVLLSSSFLAVRTVVVTGEHRLTAAQVEQAAAVSSGTPLARVDTAAVAKRVEALSGVASATVTRSWPHGLRVKVVERVPVVGVAAGGQWQLLDVTGVTVDTVAALPAGLLRLQSDDPSTTRAALAVLRSLPASLRTDVQLLKAPSAAGVTLVLRDSRVVIWGSAAQSKAKVAAAMALLRMPGHFYDVSSPEVVTRR